MITYVAGSLFDSPAQVLVNTINTEGVMGKGIALQFRKIFPEMFAEYQTLCEQGQIDIGKLWIYKTGHKWVLNFPTKRSWRQPSRLEYVEAGLKKFGSEFSELNLQSIAFPALGCGNGELDWNDVQPLMEKYLRALPLDIFIHPPQFSSEQPEHRNQNQITEWLRTEPYTLAFSEVWRDISLALGDAKVFKTSIRSFTARIVDNELEKYLEIKTPSRSYNIEYDDLLEVWSRFRTHGYLRRGIVTNTIQKVLYYIIPVFAELSYVRRVELSESGEFNGMTGGRPLTGLQYIAPIEHNKQQTLFSF
jgi:O-acetyl-ADP-ribose deacetylase (regulator of RNase III)